MSGNCKLQKVVTFQLEPRMRHEYSHLKDYSKMNVFKELEFGLVHLFYS